MPAISVQISRSSSTIKISWPMALQTVRGFHGLLCGCRMRRSRRDFPRVPSEYQTDARPATLAVVQEKLAAVVFHDLLDDGETEPCPFAASRHIGLGQAIASCLGEALAIVLDHDANGRPVIFERQRNLSRRQRLLATRLASLDRLGRVLQDVCEHLADL